MGFLDELKRLTHPYEDEMEDDYDEDEDVYDDEDDDEPEERKQTAASREREEPRRREWEEGGESGSFGQTVQPGAVQQVGTISCTLSNLKAPAKIELTFGKNKWPLWVYPSCLAWPMPRRGRSRRSPSRPTS